MNNSTVQQPRENENDRGALMLTAKKIFWAAIAILFCLLILSVILLSSRLYEYAKTDERVVQLKSNMDDVLHIFSVQYTNASGEITVSGADGQKVIAPGTSAEYTVRLRNTDKIALDYTLAPGILFTSEHKIPLLVRLIGCDGNYLLGDAKTWVPVEQLNTLTDVNTLGRGESVEYVFQWKWPFESGDDQTDTNLGILAGTGDVGLTVTFTLHAEANTSIEDNGGFFGSGRFENVALLIFILALIAAIVILLISVFRRREQDQKDPDSNDEESDDTATEA